LFRKRSLCLFSDKGFFLSSPRPDFIGTPLSIENGEGALDRKWKLSKKDIKYRTILGARILRHDMTKAEALLWGYLRDRNLMGVKFRRQHPLKGFIIDFYCPEYKIGVEVDGGIHDDRVQYDRERQMQIEATGIKVIRLKIGPG